jgi:macrolide transport system ATP-binding/permease protein
VTRDPFAARRRVIEVAGLQRIYRLDGADVAALRGVQFTIAAGEFVAIMGASGSGKSTLMHILGCLDRPTAGTYRLEGVEVARLGDEALAAIRSRRIGFVFQSFNLLARTSAAQNVALPLLYAGRDDRAPRAARAQAALDKLGLGTLARHNPNQLSGGQQQRVALARALINDPAILLADEPTGNLDSATSHEIMSVIRALNRERGVTVIVVTHEPDIAAYADRTITLRDGLIESDVRTSSFPSPRRGEGGERSEPGEGRSESKLKRIEPLTPTLSPPNSGLPEFGTIQCASRAGPTCVGRGGARAVPPSPQTPLSVPLLTMTSAAALAALARNKLRTALTMLGVFIGVAALIAMLAVGNGANEAVRKQMASLGTSLFVILPGASTQSGVRAGNSSASSLTVADAEAIERDVGTVAHVSYIDRQVAQAQYGAANWSTAVQGVTPAFLKILDWQTEAGRALTAADGETAAMVCMIGQTVYRKLFAPDEDPVGATILVKGRPLRVVGLLAARGQSSFGTDQDDVVMLPFATAERRVIGVAVPAQAPSPVTERFPPAPNPYGLQPKLAGMVNLIFVEASAPETVAEAMREATALLARRHAIRPGEPDDFNVRNLSEIASTAEKTGRVIALLLAILASISLLVGGVGIMNILLVSVTERTREIGIRMAIGARRRHVLLQFLVEAGLISLAGGAAGIAVGLSASWAIAALAHWPIKLSLAAVIGSLAFSAAVGVFFGWYPAHKAARLDPIEALRFE